MAKSNNTLCLDKFYPEKDLMITDIDQQSDKIIIRMKSTSSSCKYDYSNGFVEGTNSRLKMIKRTMYGRCGRQLLEAKLRYMGYNNNNG